MKNNTLFSMCGVLVGLVVLLSGCPSAAAPTTGKIHIRVTDVEAYEGDTIYFFIMDEAEVLIGKVTITLSSGAGHATAAGIDGTEGKYFDLGTHQVSGVIDDDGDKVADSSEPVFYHGVTVFDNADGLLELTSGDISTTVAVAGLTGMDLSTGTM